MKPAPLNVRRVTEIAARPAIHSRLERQRALAWARRRADDPDVPGHYRHTCAKLAEVLARGEGSQ